jgi:hypothetical protein
LSTDYGQWMRGKTGAVYVTLICSVTTLSADKGQCFPLEMKYM